MTESIDLSVYTVGLRGVRGHCKGWLVIYASVLRTVQDDSLKPLLFIDAHIIGIASHKICI